MEPWSWILAYLVGFTLFQLLLFRYFSDGRAFGGVSLESGEAAGPQSLDGRRPAPEPNQGPERDGVDVADCVRCPNCGTENEDEQHVTYCRNCLARLR